MAIPEAQLKTWSKIGAVTDSKNTYAAIKKVLEDTNAPYQGKDFEIFLQGSYGNDTNVFRDSDVDIVIKLNQTFSFDLDELPNDIQKTAFDKAYPTATYTLSNFKADVLSHLTKKYGLWVNDGNKAIYIAGGDNRRDADVLVAAEHRRYYAFNGVDDQRHADGIFFEPKNGGRIINFPKQHSENLTAKHQATDSWFKPTVRIAKNMRNRMITDNKIKDGLAPSYFIEGLLYNVPNDKFGTDYDTTFTSVFNWILEADRSKFLCANEMYYLLRNSNVTWPAADCDAFLEALKDFWNNWQS